MFSHKEEVVKKTVSNPAVLYTWMAITALAVTMAGFGPGFYAHFSGGGRKLDYLLHLHGAIMTAWLVVFVLQAGLVRFKHVGLHRRVGMLGLGLAILVVVVGALTALRAARRDMVSDPTALAFLATPLLDLVVFTLLAGAAFLLRRRRDAHGRLMLLANLSILSPALARLPIDAIAHGGPWLLFGLSDAFVLAFVLIDSAVHRRVQPALAWGCLLIVSAQALRVLIGAWPWWTEFAGGMLR